MATPKAMSNKNAKFEELFSKNTINIETLKKAAYGGIPQKYRPLCWRILLNTASPSLITMHQGIEKKNHRYLKDFLMITCLELSSANMGCEENKGHLKVGSEYFADYKDHFVGFKDLSLDCKFIERKNIINKNIAPRKQNIGNITEYDRKNDTELEIKVLITKDVLKSKNNFNLHKKHIHQIEIDVERINTEYLKWSNIKISFIYQNILTLIALRKPAVGYVQGMADILSLILKVFLAENPLTAESSTFFLFNNLLALIQPNYIDNQPGILSSILEFEETLRIADPELSRHIESLGINVTMFIFRWFNCLFTREFKFDFVLSIFDSIFSFGKINKFLILFSISLLVFLREMILKKDFQDVLLLLQNLTEIDFSEEDLQILFSLTMFFDKYISEKNINGGKYR